MITLDEGVGTFYSEDPGSNPEHGTFFKSFLLSESFNISLTLSFPLLAILNLVKSYVSILLFTYLFSFFLE